MQNTKISSTSLVQVCMALQTALRNVLKCRRLSPYCMRQVMFCKVGAEVAQPRVLAQVVAAYCIDNEYRGT